ncbi:MAG: helix-turn-helix domain-containing protein [Candidatus Jordarchaeum sp.]|uniref:helix-turn-helix domain-containing protein n=1 Tax=Candidatus Jordarchaeum sp. TaxID=2823881 RepID=UPI0040494B57
MGRRVKWLTRRVDLGEIDAEIDKCRARGDVRYLNKLTAIRMLALGYERKPVLDAVRISERTLLRWVEQWNLGGFKGLKPGKGAGRPPKLSEEELKELDEDLAKSPRESGYDYDLWATKLVLFHVEKKFSVSYHKNSLYKLLRTIDSQNLPFF